MTTPTLLQKRYQIAEQLGKGSFGTVYAAVDTVTNTPVAVKVESVNTKHPMLHYEWKALRLLAGDDNRVPAVFAFFTEGRNRYLVMERLGKSLESLFTECGRRFSLKTVMQVAIQLIQRLYGIHKSNLLHRDIKPDNFLITESNTIHVVDFGMAKRYRDPTTHIHIPYREGKRLVGTPRYTSINCHLGLEQSRRDDLEALGYVLIYLYKGRLPWQGVQGPNRNDKIMQRKLSTAIAALCEGMPVAFLRYFEYVRMLRFADKPDYDHLVRLFMDAADGEGIVLNDEYDWDPVDDPELELKSDQTVNASTQKSD
jgi:serine/threonine protein kinase